MNEEWWERPVCYVCDYWWLGLLLLVLAAAAFFTRGTWAVALFPTPTSTPVSLADVRVDSHEITISVSDNGNLLDGDMITVLLNGEPVLSDHTLEREPFDIQVALASGSNEVTIIALNEGRATPNTVEVRASNVIEGPPVQVSSGLQTNERETFIIYAP